MKRKSSALTTTTNVAPLVSRTKRSLVTRGSGNRVNLSLNRGMVILGRGFPKKIMIGHRYVEVVGMSTGSGTGISSYLFSCNGLYDPNITGTGHQPLYFDQMTALYNHYCVVGSKITAKLMADDAATAAKGYRFVGFVNDDNSYPSSTDLNVIEEQTLAKSITAQPNNSRPLMLELKWSAQQYFGKSVLANDELQGTATTNPVEQSYFAFGALCTDGVSPLNLRLEVNIEYTAIWKELRDVGTS